MKNPKVSIIIPVYNVEKYLEECVESILTQDYENKEIVLVNDGSTDSSPSLCDKFAEENECVKVVHKENCGLSMARNTGIEHATGDYILFVDSDDFVESNSLDKIMETAIENDADVVFLEAQKVFSDGAKQPLGDGINKTCVNGKSKIEVLRHLSQCNKYPAAAWSKLIKKNLFDENHDLLFEKGLLSEDLDWAFKLILSAKTFGCCDVMYYNYRQGRTDSITNSLKLKNLTDVVYIMKKWIDLSKGFDEVGKKFVLSELAYEYPIVTYIYASVKDEGKKSYLKELKDMSWLLNYREGKKYKIVKLFISILGVQITGKVLRRYLILRK